MPEEFFSEKVVEEMEEAFMALLKVAVTVVEAETPVAPLIGDTEVTVGGVVSGIVLLKTTSIQ